MSVVSHSRYLIRIFIENVSSGELKKKIEEFTAQKEIRIMKEQPKKDFELKEIDIRLSLIHISEPTRPY